MKKIQYARKERNFLRSLDKTLAQITEDQRDRRRRDEKLEKKQQKIYEQEQKVHDYEMQVSALQLTQAREERERLETELRVLRAKNDENHRQLMNKADALLQKMKNSHQNKTLQELPAVPNERPSKETPLINSYQMHCIFMHKTDNVNNAQSVRTIPKL